MNDSYQIGQVIYVLSNKSQSVLPGVVQEEMHHRRIDGDSISYKIAFGPPGKQKIVDLTRVDGDVYGSIEEIRETLVGRLTTYVDELCAETQKKVSSWYGDQQGSVNFGQTTDKIDPSVLLNEVNQPSAQQRVNVNYYPRQPQHYNTPTQNLRTALTDPELLQRDIEMPDGSVQKVAINLNNPKQG